MPRPPRTLPCLALAALLCACGPELTREPPTPPRPTPPRAAPRPAALPSFGVAPGRDRLHVVQNGDTLSQVARRFGVPGGHEALARLNGLAAPYSMLPGRMLRLPEDAGAVRSLLRYPEIRRSPPPLLPCGASFAAPRAEARPGCSRRFCAEGPPGTGRVCRCFQGRVQYRFEYELGPTTYPLRQGEQGMTTDATGFEVTLADLDDDGKPELVLANHEATGNGMGIRWFRLEVFAPGRRVGAVARWESAGGEGLVVREARETRCSVLSVTVESLPAEWRGAGTFWVGRSYRLSGGRLVPHPTAPVRRVRLDHSALPDAAVRPGGPFPTAAWGVAQALATPSSEGLDGEWVPSTSRAVSWVRGRIVGYTASPLRLRLRLEDGGELEVSADADDEDRALHHWGDRVTGRLLPMDYRAEAERAALIGARVDLVTYQGAWSSRIRILWR